jgi:hypothetical protein
LQSDERLCHSAPASHPRKEHVQQGPFASRALPRFLATMGPSYTRSPSPPSRVAGCAVYLAPSLSRRGETGFTSCSARPCQRAAANTPPEGPAAAR